MSKKRYIVTWMEDRGCIVEAKSEKEAECRATEGKYITQLKPRIIHFHHTTEVMNDENPQD